jgi:hypothetical protein
METTHNNTMQNDSAANKNINATALQTIIDSPLYKTISLLVALYGCEIWSLSRGPGPIPSTTRKKKVVGLERGPLSLVSTTVELLDRKVAAPV